MEQEEVRRKSVVEQGDEDLPLLLVSVFLQLLLLPFLVFHLVHLLPVEVRHGSRTWDEEYPP